MLISMLWLFDLFLPDFGQTILPSVITPAMMISTINFYYFFINFVPPVAIFTFRICIYFFLNIFVRPVLFVDYFSFYSLTVSFVVPLKMLVFGHGTWNGIFT